MPNFIDLTGQKIGRWIVLKRGEDTAYRHPRFWCRCDCGTEKLVVAQCLRSGDSTSCGCFEREQKRGICLERNTRHGLSRTPEHRTWTGIRSRCKSPKATAFPKYGAKGIKVCARWDSFEAFLADMGPRPTPAHTIDRIDPTGDYEPGNCRWATMAEQQNNRTNNVWYTAHGVTDTLIGWSKRLGRSREALRLRLKRGIPIEEAFTAARMKRA